MATLTDLLAGNEAVLTRNPRQAANVFHHVPKQRNTFLVRFLMNGSQTGQTDTTPISFVVKSVDRPKVQLKAEELHQYNKKRQVYTGFKLEPVRMQFYDSAGGAAQHMWQNYVSYYFGDLAHVSQQTGGNGTSSEYAYDITSPTFRDTPSQNGFGFTATNSFAPDADGQFYFSQIEIYHFYSTNFDRYTLVHPRITMFDPDELDFENSSVSMISMTVVYEQLKFEPNITENGDQDLVSGFQKGDPFDGDVPPVDGNGFSIPASARPLENLSSSVPVGNLLAEAPGPLSSPLEMRYSGDNTLPSSGSLGMWGDFEFGPGGNQSLMGQALMIPGVSVALDLGISINPLAMSGISMQAAINTQAWRGINGAHYDVAMGRANAVTTGYGGVADLVTAGLLVSNAIHGDRPIARPQGVRLSPESYGAMNARQSGTAQFGYNRHTGFTISLSTGPDVASWGYTGQSGYAGPVGPEYDGPYNDYQPSGLYGRYGIEENPMDAYGIPENPVGGGGSEGGVP